MASPLTEPSAQAHRFLLDDVADRIDDAQAAPDRSWLAAQAPGAAGRVDFLEGPRLDISSTSIRKLVAEGRSIRGLVPPAVERFVAEHHLYRHANDPEAQRRMSTP